MFENITNGMDMAVDDIIMCRIMSFFILDNKQKRAFKHAQQDHDSSFASSL